MWRGSPTFPPHGVESVTALAQLGHVQRSGRRRRRRHLGSRRRLGAVAAGPGRAHHASSTPRTVPAGSCASRRSPGHRIDVGAESMLARRPEAVGLVEEIGAAALLTHPATTAAAVWSRGALHPLPKGTLMGIPGDPQAALGLLTPEEVARACDETPWPGGTVDADVSVGEYVSARLGTAVVDRLVEPLLGGVYAGHAGRLSLEACVPVLFEVARSGGSLTGAARAAAQAAAANTSPVFAGLVGGMGRLPELLAACPGRPRRRDPLGHDRARAPPPQRRRMDRRDRPPARSRERSTPTPWSWRCRRRRPPGCCATLPRWPPPSWPASTTPPWPSSPWRWPGTAWASCPARASSCRRSTAAASRRARSRRTSGRGSPAPPRTRSS